MDHAYHQHQQQEPDSSLHHHHHGGDDHMNAATGGMYAQYQYSYEAIPPPMPHQQYLQQQQPQHPGEHLPHVQVTYPSPTKLRARRRSGHERPSIFDVQIDDQYHGDDRTSSGEMQQPPKSHLRAKTADDEEARKARKREMGRERQRRKRLRDKQKRDAAKAGGYDSSTNLELHRAGSRSSILSDSSYDGGIHSSASSTYATLPPMSMNISPSNAYGGSMSDAPSPAQSLSPTMGGFASDDSSWQEHTAVFGNLNLSGDNTVRAKPRATSANLSSLNASRRPSEAEGYQAFSMTGPSPAKRRKSDTQDDDRPSQVGLGVSVGTEDEAWAAQRPRPPRRTASVPEGVNMEPAASSDRSATPPPAEAAAQATAALRPSDDGMFFASTVVLALSDNEWAASLHQKLGLSKGDLERMSTELASAFDRCRLANGMSQVNIGGGGGVQTSPPRTSEGRASAFNTPSSRLSHDVNTDSPSTASNASVSSLPPNIRMAGRQPETPHSKFGSSSSSTASPAHPSLQTPVGHIGSVFQSQDYNQQSWSGTAPLSRMYDVDWRSPVPAHALSSPISGDAKIPVGVTIPPPPTHAPPQPSPALQSPVTVQPQYIANDYQTRMQFQQPRYGPGSVPIYYNPQFQQLQQE